VIHKLYSSELPAGWWPSQGHS